MVVASWFSGARMDGLRFDTFSRALATGHSRRSLTCLLGALALTGSLPWLGPAATDAKRKKKHKKQRRGGGLWPGWQQLLLLGNRERREPLRQQRRRGLRSPQLRRLCGGGSG